MRAKAHRILSALVVLGTLVPSSAISDTAVPTAIASRVPAMEKWAGNATIHKAVTAQNAEKLSLEEIMRRDEEWIGTPKNHPFKKQLMQNPCAGVLRAAAEEDRAVFEAFVMDNQGALVCTLLVTTDYWQGDEPKWQRSYDEGKGALYVAPPEYDESTKLTLVQTSVPIREGEKVIGVLMIGFNARLLRINSEAAK